MCSTIRQRFSLRKAFSTTIYESRAVQILTFPSVLISIVLLFLGYALLTKNKSEVRESFVVSREREYQLLVYDLQKRIDTLKKRQKLMLKGADGPQGDATMVDTTSATLITHTM